MYYIYGLVKNNRVVYIGQSKSLKNRIRAHKRSDKEFDDYVILDESEHKNNEMEDFYIKKHSPIYNKATNRHGHLMTVKEFFESSMNSKCELTHFYESIINLGIKPVFGERYIINELHKADVNLQYGNTFEERILNTTELARELGGIV